MNDNVTHSYTLEIIPLKADGRSYRWTIRKHGKLAQRSDRSLHSEEKARQNGTAQIEKRLSGHGD